MLIVTVLSYLAVGAWEEWRIPAAVFAAHGVIDFARIQLDKERSRLAFILDQLAHPASLVGIAVWISMDGSSLFWWQEWGASYVRGIILASGFIAAVKVSGVLIGLTLEPYLRQVHSDGEREGHEPQGLRDGGRAIGYLERALIFVFLMAGQPAAIGFLIAAKSILRFGEVREWKSRIEAEYIIIGTLWSFLAGSMASFGCRYLLELAV